MAESDDRICVVDPAANFPTSNATEHRDRNSGPLGDLPKGDSGSIHERLQQHVAHNSRIREPRQPQAGRIVNIREYLHNSPKGESVARSVARAIFEAFADLVEREGQTVVCNRAGLPTSTADRYVEAVREGRIPARLDSKNLDALMRLEEVRSAAAAVLLRRADEDSAAWEAIGASLSDLYSPAAGWTLVRKLQELSELGEKDPSFSILQGAIDRREEVGSRNLARGKHKKPSSK